MPPHRGGVRPVTEAPGVLSRRLARFLGRFRIELETIAAHGQEINSHRGGRTCCGGLASARRTVGRPAWSQALTIMLAVAVMAADSCCSSSGRTVVKNFSKYTSS